MLLHAALMTGAALALACLLPWAAALAAGRTGPQLAQPLHDARRLLRKRPVVTEAAGPLKSTNSRLGDTLFTVRPWLCSHEVTASTSLWAGPYSVPTCAGVSHWW